MLPDRRWKMRQQRMLSAGHARCHARLPFWLCRRGYVYISAMLGLLGHSASSTTAAMAKLSTDGATAHSGSALFCKNACRFLLEGMGA